ncbi:transcriptional regulator NanR [Bosea sp. (in: a-proteobacteria)]|jgi:DNA-binding FadR family transcriptional regulator|uniref:transcriptional regulator NanR n=1 Tax=Bosea sp. (in: a-proteobacteria) TaxID=1871050 RepID=UPI003F6F4A34
MISGAIIPDQRPIRRRKLYEDIVERLEAAINEGHYAPGDQLPAERELMEAYGVGRTAVREALFALQRMGLIAISSGERARVSQPSAGTMIGELSGVARYLLAKPGGAHHFQQARTMFEIGVARLAAEIATPEDIARLEAALAANRAALEQGRAFERTDVAFHFVLAEITRNPIFTALHDGLSEWLTEQRTTSLKARGAAQAAYAAHKRIHEAVAAHDPQAAAEAMRAHLSEVGDYYWKASDV